MNNKSPDIPTIFKEKPRHGNLKALKAAIVGEVMTAREPHHPGVEQA